MLAKLRREQFGQSSERGKQLIEQLELAIEDLEESQAVEEAKVEAIAPDAAKEKPARKPRGPRKLPDNLPVERIVEPPPCACGKCGSSRLHKLGETVSKRFGGDDVLLSWHYRRFSAPARRSHRRSVSCRGRSSR